VSLLIAGGLVVDPAQALSSPLDLLIEDGKIVALSPPGTIPAEGRRVIEARNLKGELFGFERTRAISMRGAEEIANQAQVFGQQDDILAAALEPV